MQFLANLISKIGVFVLFLLLEGFSVFLMFTQSGYHKGVIGEKLMDVNGYFSGKIASVSHFFDLPNENKTLALENARLRQALKELKKSPETILVQDSLNPHTYTYMPAQVVDYSLRKRDNYFLINKGRADGVKEDMAVLSSDGLVGAVLSTSEHYASVLSILHSKTNIKAKVKNLDYFGIIQWPGEDHRILALTEIPKYLNVKVGDTVVTAGASAIYPEGELIGRVSKLSPNPQTGDYNIEVTTFNDLADVKNVYVVENLVRPDILQAQQKEEELVNDTE
ncbi:rod shape-determining protein MreC [Ornithobacterium rhinotracheale]|uniref:rod shape-determining protein MreC n=1 Tax=Ornithobacterium rhinotracheale TaxID=28251 RepID=UPI00129C3D64|nr:rod shape-determining protein MreC [Ornithobacterium rhinotracheale]MRJ07526.1 rod shape-determining protein MreC [Ornithobacterium rhinotracheale]MRJ10837.1 rod shape-determining protein MreC [Ornithobacterium rhinotracheale]UOH78120.1 rod shape-determining protein MreC [Ornithobacterium rhinotracheale]